MRSGETARFWRHPALPDVDLLRARFVHHRYARHSHDAYAIALVREGVEQWWYRGDVVRAGAGGIGLVNPDTVHTGEPGVPEGWAYRVLYPSVPVLRGIADELGLPPGTPWFPEPVVADPQLAALLLAAHRAAETGDALAASSLTHRLFGGLLTRYAGRRPVPPESPRPDVRLAVRARDLLLDRLVTPPSLAELAAEVGTGPYALARSFRSHFGLPPHAFLTQHRVGVARRLLDSGGRPADVAAAVGFVDQAHLSRHFRRIVGVPPGAYARQHAAR
ncbi:AraC family transcriptional regulator [Actinocatenispora thailandica]|uniref:AraC family transcriptional regulator n=1 Tax=Actinocatenispora thailandica TaxID=227318 RepID=A0A7R7DRS0_9ACTN|nr:AraC family transcriptional regulator [Actinocatenispora thailandica]BCJ36511.1 AraC family transcriptional regulator [Actinocatenispora thailandica]